MKNFFLLISLYFLCVFVGNAQEAVIKHTVEKGETVFQLSRKYNVTPEDIYTLNPSAVDVIRIGEVLSIPPSQGQNSPNPTSSSSSDSTSTSNTITYAVVYGDTKYSLARRFGITLEAFESQNPHTKNGLQAGHILKIQNERSPASNNESVTIIKTHLVLKGQTLWGISKENDLSVEQLVNANSEILSGILQIGQVLKIPEPSNSVDSNENTYLVQRGDTKFGLSKKYNVTIAELEQSNPHIIGMLMAGHTIQIPTTQGVSENEIIEDPTTEETEVSSVEEPIEEPIEQKVAAIETDTTLTLQEDIAEQTKTIETDENSNVAAYSDYEIQPKETLYGLAKKAGMSISDFVALNPQLSDGVKIGMVIQMPTSDSVQASSNVDPEVTLKKSNQKYVDLSQSIEALKKNNILLFLPFSEAQFNSDYQQTISFSDVSDDFTREHLEFYRGAKIAQDSARALGLDFNINVIETNSSERKTKLIDVAKENSADTYDAIIIPFYGNEVVELASFVEDKNIPVITAASSMEEISSKNLFQSVPSLNSQRKVMLDYMNSNNANIIVVCDIARKESKEFISEFAPNATIIDVNKRGTFDADNFIAQLDKSRLNYVILESEKNSVFLSTTNLLFGQVSKIPIQLALLDKSLIPSTDDVSKKRFVILQMIYPSLTPLEEAAIASDFSASYKRNFSVEPTQNVKYGFDLIFDTLLRTSQSKSFEASAESDISEYTTLKFDYKLNKYGGYDNNGIYIIQYNSDGTLKELK
ncbi:MAG: LysM peptidoglycan-binding domain-containing protein [Aquaticitalea sp.]